MIFNTIQYLLCLHNNKQYELLLYIRPHNYIRNKIKKIEKLGYKCVRHNKIIINTYNSTTGFNPKYYIKNVNKPMIIYTLLKLIDTNPDLMKEITYKYDTPLRTYMICKMYNILDLSLEELDRYNFLRPR